MNEGIQHSAPLVNSILLFVLTALFIYRSRNWNIPKQDALLRDLRYDIDVAQGKADGVAREHDHEVRRNNDIAEKQLAEIKKLGAQINDLLKMRDQIREIDDRTIQLDQAVSALACSEKAWMASGYCPLRKIACPLDTKET
jgi:hypothetical protein